MDLLVRPEPDLDLDQTARLANEAFGAIAHPFTPTRLRWLYREAFGHGAQVLGLFDGERKVGQVALLGQRLQLPGGPAEAVALVDLFIMPAFRSREAIATLYGRVAAVCRERGVRFILAVPNGKAVGVNRKFLGLDTAATLEIRAGLMPPHRARRVRFSGWIADLAATECEALFAPFTPPRGAGLAWSAGTLRARLRDPASAYAVHATDDLILFSTAKTRRHVPSTWLCGLLPGTGRTASAGDVRALVAAACKLHSRPAFVYVGRNSGVPLPGWPLPARLRPSVMIVQARDMQDGAPVALDRFELIDFDFA